MARLNEQFGLMQYSEEFVDKIIHYRMKRDAELNRYLSSEEIAERENCDVKDVEEILLSTCLVWNH